MEDPVNRIAIAELFDYVNWAWERIEKTIDEQPEGTFTKEAPGSGWPRLADCCFHSVSAYDGWINGEWGIGDGNYFAESEDPIESWEKFKAYRARCVEAFNTAMKASEDSFSRRRRFEIEPGVVEMMSTGDILANLVLHERGHHGDLNTLFHQLGIRSYIIDYRYFVTRRDEFAVDNG
jgi:uncharacterized damage-inducible protein DinB